MVVKVKPLDITLVSAKGITDVNIFSKMSVYAVVVVTLSGKIVDSKNTPVAEGGGSNPIWDFPMKFVVDREAAETGGHDLYIQLMCRRRFLRDKAIGLVHFPVTRLYEFAKGERSAFLITAPVREGSVGSGEAKGKIKFSFRFGESYNKPKV